MVRKAVGFQGVATICSKRILQILTSGFYDGGVAHILHAPVQQVAVTKWLRDFEHLILTRPPQSRYSIAQ
jgi:hypothetical protein